MSVDKASRKEKLWHEMRADLAKYAPETNDSKVLMCPTCARWLPFDDFSLEHIIPKQALAHDPIEAREAIPTSQRSGLILLCKIPLRIRDKTLFENGCNGWKGRFYDAEIREVLTGAAISGESRRTTQTHIIALLAASFLALQTKFGYQIALTPAGVVMRHQFFMPRTFHRDLPMSSQMVMGAPMPEYSEKHRHLWEDPFRFEIKEGTCMMVFRTFGISLPLSRDPRQPFVTRLRHAPHKYKMRPDFRTAFE